MLYRFNAIAHMRHSANGYLVKIIKEFSDGETVKVEIVNSDWPKPPFVCLRSELTKHVARTHG